MSSKTVRLYGKITAHRRLVSEHYLLTMTLSDRISRPLPGQFIMVRLQGREEPFLARPFSIYSCDEHGKKVSIKILYRVVGRGTLLISELRRGDVLEIFGPYGKPFIISPNASNILLISGGVGIAPISFLAAHCKKNKQGSKGKILCYSGAATADRLLGLDGLRKDCSSVKISTDDGSMGYHGMVTELFADEALSYRPDQSVLYACGPVSMMKRLSEILREYPIPCQILLEERMACGVGACLGCCVKAKGAGQMEQYVRVCTDGPVFNIEDIIWK